MQTSAGIWFVEQLLLQEPEKAPLEHKGKSFGLAILTKQEIFYFQSAQTRMFEIPMHMTRSVLSLETKHISLRFFDLYSLFHSLRFCLVSHQRLKKINTSLNFHPPKLKTLKPSNCNWQITNILKIKILLQVSIAIQSLISTLWQKKKLFSELDKFPKWEESQVS